MNENPEQRDKAIARLAAEALRAGGSAADPACPDMEVLAAYAERGLEANEAAYWERHFSDCGRCRKMLALLAVSAEALAQDEAQPRSQRTVATPAPVISTLRQPVARPRHSPLRWLVPALGAAAAVALWFALRPLTPTTQTVAELQKASPAPNTPPSAAPAAPATNSPSADSSAANSEIAQAEIPPPPAAVPTSRAKQIEPRRDLDELKKDQKEPAAPAAPSEAPLTDATSARVANPAESDLTQRQTETLSPAARPAAPPPAPPSGAEEKAKDQLSAAAASASARNEKNSPPAAPSANAASANLPTGQAVAQPQSAGSRQPPAVGDFQGFGIKGPTFPSAAEPIPTVVYSPDQSVAWRLGPAGHIERSIDKGRGWQPQSSGVTADLLAGAAVSSQVAWIAGRGGVILRTTDGATWQRIIPPMGLTLDWTSIEASDAQHATITSADQRRFSTADGGRTWTAQ